MKILLIPTQWSDTVGEPWPMAHMLDITSLARSWYLEASHGKVAIDWTIAPWTRAAQPENSTTFYHFQANSQYAYTLALTTKNPNFAKGWSNGWINCGGSDYAKFATIHELGHMMGLNHAGGLRTGSRSQTLYSFPTYPVLPDVIYYSTETGDSCSSMGYTPNYSHFNAYEKNKLGWINYTAWDGKDRIYSLTPTSETGGNLYAVRVQLDAPNPRQYWIERREATGFDAVLGTGGAGIQIRMSGDMKCSEPRLVDCYPSQEGGDIALKVGDKLRDGVIAVEVAGPGDVRIYKAGPAPIPPTPPIGNAMTIEAIKARAATLTLGQVTQAIKEAGIAEWVSLQPDAYVPPGSESPPGTSVPPASEILALGGTWKLGVGSNPPILFNGLQAGDGRAPKITWTGTQMRADVGGGYVWNTTTKKWVPL